MKKLSTRALLLVSAAGLAIAASLGKSLFNTASHSTSLQLDGSAISLSKNAGSPGERAKPGGFDAAEQLLRSTQSSKLWADYRASKVGNAKAGAEILGAISAIGYLPSTRATVQEIVALLQSKVSREEKMELLRLLGRNLYWETSDSSLRSDIARTISSIVFTSDDKGIVNAATLEYTRLGYFPDSMSVLERASKSDAITQQDYYGEMAHMFLFAPAAAQLTLLRAMESGGNDFARDVLVSMISSKDAVSSLPPEVQASTARILSKWEPELGQGYGTTAAITWEQWFEASIALDAKLSGESESAVVSKFLRADDSADPRKLIFALWNESTAETVRAAFDRATLGKIDERLVAFGMRYPDRSDIQEDVQTARRNLAGSPKK
jgi:hypothetical protein